MLLLLLLSSEIKVFFFCCKKYVNQLNTNQMKKFYLSTGNCFTPKFVSVVSSVEWIKNLFNTFDFVVINKQTKKNLFIPFSFFFKIFFHCLFHHYYQNIFSGSNEKKIVNKMKVKLASFILLLEI